MKKSLFTSLVATAYITLAGCASKNVSVSEHLSENGRDTLSFEKWNVHDSTGKHYSIFNSLTHFALTGVDYPLNLHNFSEFDSTKNSVYFHKDEVGLTTGFFKARIAYDNNANSRYSSK